MTDYIAAYREYLAEEKQASANTLSSYIRDLTQFQSWLITNDAADLRKVKKDTINEYLLHMNHSGKSPATVTRSTASIKSFYNYMVQIGAVKTNPAKAVVAMKVELEHTGPLLVVADAIYFEENVKPEIQVPGILYDSLGFRRSAQYLLDYAKRTGAKILYGHDMAQFETLIKSHQGYYD